jgi:hypothetical protein
MVKNASDDELRRLLMSTNGYTQSYLANIMANNLLHKNSPEQLALLRQALLRRKQGGPLNYTDYSN